MTVGPFEWQLGHSWINGARPVPNILTAINVGLKEKKIKKSYLIIIKKPFAIHPVHNFTFLDNPVENLSHYVQLTPLKTNVPNHIAQISKVN